MQRHVAIKIPRTQRQAHLLLCKTPAGNISKVHNEKLDSNRHSLLPSWPGIYGDILATAECRTEERAGVSLCQEPGETRSRAEATQHRRSPCHETSDNRLCGTGAENSSDDLLASCMSQVIPCDADFTRYCLVLLANVSAHSTFACMTCSHPPLREREKQSKAAQDCAHH